MFTGHYDEEFNTNGTILVWSDGVFDREFSVQEEDEFGGSAYSYDAQIAFTPDGNIFLIDSGGNMKVVDPQGNVVRDDFIDGYELGIYGVNDVAIAPDGTIIIATLEGITRLSPDGIVIDTFGTTQGVGLEDAPEFESGQFSSTGPQALAVLSDGSLIAISSNGTYNLVIRLDYSAAE
jgi:WD40 repeat protein